MVYRKWLKPTQSSRSHCIPNVGFAATAVRRFVEQGS
jgi:hypothetical protein